MQRRVHRYVEFDFPADFPERLAQFKDASGLSWRGIARALGVSPHRLRQWRNGRAVPGTAHLFLLLTVAESMGLRDGVLMCPRRDLPECADLDVRRR